MNSQCSLLIIKGLIENPNWSAVFEQNPLLSDESLAAWIQSKCIAAFHRRHGLRLDKTIHLAVSAAIVVNSREVFAFEPITRAILCCSVFTRASSE